MKDENLNKDQGINHFNNNSCDKIYSQLEVCKAILEKGYELNTEEKTNKLLKERAGALANEAEKVEEGRAYLEVVEFFLANEKYALELDYIREVYSVKELTPLPCTPSFVLGIINLRGQILSIVNLKNLYKLTEEKSTNYNRVIILYSDEMEFGILADAILGVKTIPLNAIQPALPTFSDMRAEHLKGITEDRTVILNGEKILSDKKILIHKELKT